MSENNYSDFPFEHEEIPPEEKRTLWNFMEGFKIDFVTVGPKKYFLTDSYMTVAADIYNMKVRSDDIFVATFPKSGTTWIQELVWLLENNLDFEKAESIYLNARFPFLDITTLMPSSNSQLEMPEHVTDTLAKAVAPLNVKQISELPSPRLIKTHLPLSLLPPTLLETGKVVYIARDPRDAAVSFFHHDKLMKLISSEAEFKTYWKYFINGQVLWSPYFSHVLEAWEQRNNPNLLFLFYEDLLKDLPAGIRKVAKFLNKELTEEQVTALNEHLQFDNFKKNKSVNMQVMQEIGFFATDGAFVRKGKKGGWRDNFDEEMTAQAETWINDNLRDTDFRFPST